MIKLYFIKKIIRGKAGEIKDLLLSPFVLDLSNKADSSHTHAQLHDPATEGDGIDVTGQVITNTDKGSDAVSSHEGTHDHTLLTAHGGRHNPGEDPIPANNWHGIETIGAYSFNNSTHVFSVKTPTYWCLGKQVVADSPATVDLDDIGLVRNTLYFIFFEDDSGTLQASTDFWDLTRHVPVATVFWNGSAGAIQYEAHGYKRDIEWHKWAHLSVGTKYYTGYDQILPTTANDASIEISGGTILDEDIAFTVSGSSTNIRGWYKVSGSVYTFADYSFPYLGASGDPYWLDTDDYTLKSVANNDYVCYWVYASNDLSIPIYVIPTHASAAYSTISQARAETQPNLVALPINAEMKLLYRWIYKGDGEYQEGTDYRRTSSLPGGGSTTTNAAGVSFAPAGNIAATSVQSAIEELDGEKIAINNVVPTVDGGVVGPQTNQFNCGYTSSAIGDLVYLDSSSTWQKCDATGTVAQYGGLLGIALEVKASGAALNVALPGCIVYCTAFPTLTIGSVVYMSSAGAITHTPPSATDDAIRVIGWAVHADKIYFYPSQDYIIHT